MPIYEFECSEHGCFELTRPMARVREPAACPECGALAKRLLSAPNLATGSAVGRKATAINERSQHEPRVSERHVSKASGEPEKRAVYTSRGGYPWAIGH